MNESRNRPLQTCGVIALVATLLAVAGLALALWARANAVAAVEARNRADAVAFARQLGYTPEREIGINNQCMSWGFERTCTIYVMFTSPADKQAIQQVIDQFPPQRMASLSEWRTLVNYINNGSGRTIVETVPPNFQPNSGADAWYWSVTDQRNQSTRIRLYEVSKDPRQYHINGVLIQDNVIFVSLSPD